MKKSKFIIFTLIIIIAFLSIYVYFTRLLPKPLAGGLAIITGEVNSIQEISTTTTGPIYRCVIGKDYKDKKKAVWISYKVVHSVSLEQGISKENALKIAHKKGIENVKDIQLTYIANIEGMSQNISEGVYWYIRDNKNKTILIEYNTGNIKYSDNE
ncbi:MAG: hypothetical protein FH761_01965 [Firmicutes bacterium]|nr:hypothetical protein [Bacillota bacterium]